MRIIPCVAFAVSLTSLSCGAAYPAPTQRMADAMSAERSADEIGAGSNPQGQLHLKLAQEQIVQAKTFMASGDNRKAEFALARAKSDAELALAITRAASAKVEAQQAVDKANALQTQNRQLANPSQGGPQ